MSSIFFFFNDTATTEIYTLSLHDALPISPNEDLIYCSASESLKSSVTCIYLLGRLLGIKLCGSVPKAGESVSVSKCGGKLVSVFKASVVLVPKAGKPISVSKGGK